MNDERVRPGQNVVKRRRNSKDPYDDGAMGSSSGLLLLGVRYYSPAHGRFWSWDPVPSLNLYAYVENSATMAIDPSGRVVMICWRPLISYDPQFFLPPYFRPLPRDPQNIKCFTHWFFSTSLCGCVGWGPDGVIWGCKENIAGEGPVQCITVPYSPAQERCICDLARNAAKGWKMCGLYWRGKDYDLVGRNCQDFVNCILKKCVGGTMGGALIGGPDFDRERAGGL